tara:strand:- start:122 stop:739 length:618 start_codon:yes stop_codon:yes gene_type:complete
MSSEIKTNTISEVTSGSGVTIDSVKLKDGALDTGSIGNDVTYSDKYYASWKVNASQAFSANTDVYVNFDGSTAPYWVADQGTSDATDSTTAGTNNFYRGDAVSNLKIAKKGVYFINLCATFGVDSTGDERRMMVRIQDGSGTDLATGADQVVNSSSSQDYGSASISLVKLVNAGDQFRFALFTQDNGGNVRSDTRLNIFLIKPVA